LLSAAWQEARDNMRYYESFKRRTGGSGAMNGTMSFLQASAEAVPMPDQSVDVLLCVYLFHELPSEVLTQVVKEMGRLVKPGGLVVITDSIQVGPRLPHSNAFAAT
jgi:ubiquinone/menaquinone biosynthesis C-methylase UbiE